MSYTVTIKVYQGDGDPVVETIGGSTLGDRAMRAGVHFNPSGNRHAQRLKILALAFLDALEEAKYATMEEQDKRSTPPVWVPADRDRYFATAGASVEAAVMYGVKAVHHVAGELRDDGEGEGE